jgi:hypothetical protein
MASDPDGPDRDVRRPRREGGIPVYPINILVVVVAVAVIGHIAAF